MKEVGGEDDDLSFGQLKIDRRQRERCQQAGIRGVRVRTSARAGVPKSQDAARGLIGRSFPGSHAVHRRP